jgi:hypothetical protein
MGDSMSTIINATTTNGVVIQPDNSGSLVLQTNNGTTALTIDTSQNATFAGTLTATGKLASSSMPTGSVLQVVQGLYATQVLSTSLTYADTGLTATITPSSTSNKILVLVTADGVYASGGANAISAFRIVKNGSSLYEFGNGGNGATPTLTILTGSCSVNYLDSPATISATTYKLQIQNKYATGTVGVSTFNGAQSITLMEIKG